MNLDISMDGFVANLLKRSLTNEVLDEADRVIFTAMSPRRQHRVVVVDTNNVEAFFVNLDDIRSASTYLAHRLSTNAEAGSGSFNCALLHKEIGMQEVAFLLTIICPTDMGSYRQKVHVGSLPRALILGIRYQIPDVVMQCRRLVMEADYTSLSTKSATNWFEAMERSTADEISIADHRIQIPGRAHLIVSMVDVFFPRHLRSVLLMLVCFIWMIPIISCSEPPASTPANNETTPTTPSYLPTFLAEWSYLILGGLELCVFVIAYISLLVNNCIKHPNYFKRSRGIALVAGILSLVLYACAFVASWGDEEWISLRMEFACHLSAAISQAILMVPVIYKSRESAWLLALSSFSVLNVLVAAGACFGAMGATDAKVKRFLNLLSYGCTVSAGIIAILIVIDESYLQKIQKYKQEQEQRQRNHDVELQRR